TLVKYPEPLVPLDGLQRVLAGIPGEVDPQHAAAVAGLGSPHACRVRTARFDPTLDLGVVHQCTFASFAWHGLVLAVTMKRWKRCGPQLGCQGDALAASAAPPVPQRTPAALYARACQRCASLR